MSSNFFYLLCGATSACAHPSPRVPLQLKQKIGCMAEKKPCKEVGRDVQPRALEETLVPSLPPRPWLMTKMMGMETLYIAWSSGSSGNTPWKYVLLGTDPMDTPVLWYYVYLHLYTSQHQPLLGNREQKIHEMSWI